MKDVHVTPGGPRALSAPPPTHTPGRGDERTFRQAQTMGRQAALGGVEPTPAELSLGRGVGAPKNAKYQISASLWKRHRSSLKDIRENLIKWQLYQVNGQKDSILKRCQLPSILIYKFNVSLIKTQDFLWHMKLILKLILKSKRSRIATQPQR